MMKRAVTGAILMLAMHQPRAATPPKMNAFAEGDRLIYGRIVEAFRKNKVDVANRQRDVLAKNYPKSVHLDNAYYLSGVLAYQNGQMAEAVRNFGAVTDQFPRSNKRPAALFAKGKTYEKLNLPAQANAVWSKLVAEYPGSQDAQRAQVQLELKKMKR